MAQIEALNRNEPRIEVPVPEPGLTPEKLLARAAALRPLLRERQQASDERGYYTDDIHQEFLKGGFYRVLQPRMFGGYQFDFPTFVKIIIEISRGHPSTGWCYTLATSHALLIGSHWSEQAQREIFGPTGDFRSPHRAPPNGKFTKVPGGYKVSGTWSYSSGVPVSTHFTGGGMIVGDNGVPYGVNFTVPIDQIEILPDWGGDASLGMQGSGSNSVRVTDVFVPEHYITHSDRMTFATDMSNGTPGTRLHGDPMYLGQLGGPYHTTLAAITTGTARAALDEFEEIMRTKKVMFNPTAGRLTDQESQRPLGKAMALTDSAEALTLACAQQYVDLCARWAKDRTPISAEDTLRTWGMAQEACFMACEAVELLFHRASATAANRGQRIQRYFRDVQMYRIHPAAQPWVAAATAQAHLGLPIWMFGNAPPPAPGK